MNCTAVNTIIDEHRERLLTATERKVVDAHLRDCGDCAASWFAHAELCAVTVPGMASALLDSVLGAVNRSNPPRHGARRAAVLGAVLLAGAALAIGVVQLRGPVPDGAASGSIASRARPSAAATPSGAVQNSTSATRDTRSLPVDTGAIDLTPAPVVRAAPDYPAAAQERRLDGSVTLQYDVNAKGTVENVSVVESTDAIFEEAAVTALSQWKWLPRIAAGKRVAALNQRTVIRFQVAGAPHPGFQAALPPGAPSPQFDYAGFSAATETAWARVAAEDLRGAELELDEIRALYQPNGFQEGSLWDFYAYLYTVQGNYDRAIDAYEKGIASYAGGGVPSQGSWLPLATLYYARHQYDVALRTLLTYKERIKGTPAERNRNPAADELIARLAALGVTEATLPPRR